MKILRLFSDMTFDEIAKSSSENKISIGSANVSFKEGKSVFKERKISRFKIWKSRRNLGIYLDGSLGLYSLESTEKDPMLHSNFGTLEEIKKFIASEIAKTKSRQKGIQTWQFIVLMALLGIVLVLQLKTVGIIQ